MSLGIFDEVMHDRYGLRSVNIVAGADRYLTADAAAGYDMGTNFCCVGNDPYVGYASGTTFADALTGGAAMATIHGRLFLTAPTSVPDTGNMVDELSMAETHTAFVFGGPVAVSQNVENQLSALLQAPIVK
jgi:putative cell wall-binding protein